MSIFLGFWNYYLIKNISNFSVLFLVLFSELKSYDIVGSGHPIVSQIVLTTNQKF